MAGRQQYLAAVGTDQNAIGILGESVHGITIDNPSGSWLLVLPDYDYVPPYTLGWSRDYTTGLASVSVRFTNGPAGQISTRQGDPIQVVLTSFPVGVSSGVPSPGSAFVTRLDQPELTVGNITLAIGIAQASALVDSTLLGGSTTNRLRIYSAAVSVDVSFPATRLDDHFLVSMRERTTAASDRIYLLNNELHGNKQAVEALLAAGYYDLQPGSEIRCQWSCIQPPAAATQDNSLRFLVNYAII